MTPLPFKEINSWAAIKTQENEKQDGIKERKRGKKHGMEVWREGESNFINEQYFKNKWPIKQQSLTCNMILKSFKRYLIQQL